MDPVSLIVAALGAGAAAAAKDTAGEAVKDAYHGLRGLLRRLFGHHPGGDAAAAAADATVDQYEQKPDADPAPVKAALEEAGAGGDADLVAAAQKLLGLVDPEGSAAGKFTVNVAGNVQGQVVGDHATVTMNFGDPPKAG